MESLLALLVQYGYSTDGERRSILEYISRFPPPYNADMEGKIKWAEFCRALELGDFATGDIVNLNGVSFEVVGLPED